MMMMMMMMMIGYAIYSMTGGYKAELHLFD